jgi:hypothetical protein
MQLSAEIRWFWRTTPPPGFEEWFRKPGDRACPAGGGGLRLDEYLRDPSQCELGVKRRGGKKDIEVKGLVTHAERKLKAGPFAGPIEIWAKWASQALEVDANAAVKTIKRRWLRKFDTTTPLPVEIPLNDKELPVDKKQPLPARGCNVELTEVTLASGKIWWTLGFEAFGDFGTLAEDVCKVASFLAGGAPPNLSGGWLASYPTWLEKYATRK